MTQGYCHNPVREYSSLDWNPKKRDIEKFKKYLGGRIIRILLGDGMHGGKKEEETRILSKLLT